MKIIINSYNTLSAGTSIVSKQLLESMTQTSCQDRFHVIIPNIKIFNALTGYGHFQITRLPVFWGPFKYIFRFFYEFFIFPITMLIKKPDVVLIMANYSPLRFNSRKIVLMQHSYLVDESIYSKIHTKTKILEQFRQLIFHWTIRSSDEIVVQTEYIKHLLQKKYNVQHCKIHVLPNPLSKDITSFSTTRKNNSWEKEKIAIYVSRYNPHKNHQFIVTLAESHKGALQKENIKFHITINSAISAAAENLIKEIKSKQLEDIIINIGEIPHHQISHYYQKACCLFFPSKTESFGNVLIEAMYFGLPILVPDLGYARSVCGDAGYYYNPDDSDDAFNKLCQICKNESLRHEYSNRSLKQAKLFPDSKTWAKQLLGIITQKA